MIAWVLPLMIAATPLDALKEKPPAGCALSKTALAPTRHATEAVDEMNRTPRPTSSFFMVCSGVPTSLFAWQMESPAAAQKQLGRLAELLWAAPFPSTPPPELLFFKAEWVVLLSGPVQAVGPQLTGPGGFFTKGEPVEDITADQLAQLNATLDCAQAKWACAALEAFAKGTRLPAKSAECRVGVGTSRRPAEEWRETLLFLCVSPTLVESNSIDFPAARKDEQAAVVASLKGGRRLEGNHELFKSINARPRAGNARRDH